MKETLPVNQHDEKHQSQHIQNRRKTLQNLSDEPPYSTAKVIINQENGPQRPSDAKVVLAVCQNHQSFNDHDEKGKNFDGCSFMQHESSPSDPTRFQRDLYADQDKCA